MSYRSATLVTCSFLSAILLGGCGGSSAPTPTGSATSVTPSGTLAPGGATKLYVLDGAYTTSGSIDQFNASNATKAAASASLQVSNLVPETFAMGPADQLYVYGQVPGSSSSSFLAYDVGTFPSLIPTRTFKESPTGKYGSPYGSLSAITVDNSGRLYVAYSSGQVSVFSATANGPAATPVQEFVGVLPPSTYLNINGIAVDSAHNVYVTTGTLGIGTTGQIFVFPAGATGAVSPIRSIQTGASTTLFGLAVDAAQNIYVAQQSTSNGGAVVEFGAGASGSAVPLRTIAGAATGLTYPINVQLDNAGNCYVLAPILINGVQNYSIFGFGPSASGNVAPGLALGSSGALSIHPALAVR